MRGGTYTKDPLAAMNAVCTPCSEQRGLLDSDGFPGAGREWASWVLGAQCIECGEWC